MLNSFELPDCFYPNQPVLICPSSPTPNHLLYLSNVDDQKFLRFSIKYLYLYKKSVCLNTLKVSLAKVLVHYYPLAGRLRNSVEDDQKLEVDCNGGGAVFAEAFLDITADEFLEFSRKPNRSWRKLLYRKESLSSLDIPPLVVQVTALRCGGMILCTAINHSLCDGIGTSQFLHDWARMAAKSNLDQPIRPFHDRHVLKPRNPHQITFAHPQYSHSILQDKAHVDINIVKFLQSQPLVSSSLTFTPSYILRLKRECVPSLKCTTFEVLAAHTWRSWVKSLDLSPPSLIVNLLFSVNVRKKLNLPEGYYGNGFVLACAQATVTDLVKANLGHSVKLVQEAKSTVGDGYVRSMIDLLEVERSTAEMELSRSLVISQWSKLGLEEVDFGEGKPVHMGPLSSDIYCLFLPVIGNSNAVRVLLSLPETVARKFEFYMKEFLDYKDVTGETPFEYAI